MADVQCDLGEKTTCELVAQYGEGTAVFHHCDNTKDEDVKGENSTWPPLMSALWECQHTIFPNSKKIVLSIYISLHAISHDHHHKIVSLLVYFRLSSTLKMIPGQLYHHI